MAIFKGQKKVSSKMDLSAPIRGLDKTRSITDIEIICRIAAKLRIRQVRKQHIYWKLHGGKGDKKGLPSTGN
ncbi:MAG: hypothetical protein GY841_11845 [FCB group bacterium]|nr:hypothetical protein [FCB group bacterium]